MNVDWGFAMRVAQDHQREEGALGTLARAYVQLHSRYVSPPMPLTKRQSEVLRFIANHITDNGYAPTLEEISKAFGYRSLATSYEQLTNLQRKRWIIREHNTVRGILILHWPEGGEQ